MCVCISHSPSGGRGEGEEKGGWRKLPMKTKMPRAHKVSPAPTSPTHFPGHPQPII